jgi:hypothetical protein
VEWPEFKLGAAVWLERSCFGHHAARRNYREHSPSGSIGSGVVETTCCQRPGQIGTDEGRKHRCGLQLARRNDHWVELWAPAAQPWSKIAPRR